MTEKRKCDICNLDVSKTNWSKHIKTKKHLGVVQARPKHCGVCHADAPSNHLKSPKKSSKLIKKRKS
jgi:predicted  nucleic acid-binding Zn-ribbon protein